MSLLYDTKPWREFRESVLDANAECALAHLAGNCRGPLNLHHVDPLAEGGPAFPDEGGVAVLCARHHRLVHVWRSKDEKTRWKRCPHQHRTPESREQCERRLNGLH